MKKSNPNLGSTLSIAFGATLILLVLLQLGLRAKSNWTTNKTYGDLVTQGYLLPPVQLLLGAMFVRSGIRNRPRPSESDKQ